MIAAKPLTELSDNELRDLLVRAHRDRKLAEYQDGMMAYQTAVDAAVRLRTTVIEELKRRLRAAFTEEVIVGLLAEEINLFDQECRKEAHGR
jgi:hypothetical protein